MLDNIVAISSGSKINQPISIIRISGPDVLKIIKKIFVGKIGKDHQITFGRIVDANNKIIDEVLVMWFTGEQNNGEIIYKNYVGEPLIEINCHGGIVVTNKILELILNNGTRLALPGEFTRRAFLNGKIDLVKAEAIHDLIMAKTEKQAEISVNKFTGKTSEKLESLSKKISYLISLCEVNIDYPEYNDIEVISEEKMLPILNELIYETSEIIEISENAKIIFEGVTVAILGKPNVGKSSILNALLGDDKAIVTDIPGTTRDTIEVSYQIDGILFKLVDTAGLRKTSKKIEVIGIKKSMEQLKKSDLIVHVLDPTQKNNDFDAKIKKEAKKLNKIYLEVINKSDLFDENTYKQDEIVISAISNDIKNLEKAMIQKFKNVDINNEKILSNTRQISLIKKTYQKLSDAKEALINGTTFDVVIVDIHEAWENLQNIKGQLNKDDLLNEMFKNFCLGK